MLQVLAITGIIALGLGAIYFWTTVPDALKGIAMLNHMDPIVRFMAREHGYGFGMLAIRLVISLILTALTIWLILTIK